MCSDRLLFCNWFESFDMTSIGFGGYLFRVFILACFPQNIFINSCPSPALVLGHHPILVIIIDQENKWSPLLDCICSSLFRTQIRKILVVIVWHYAQSLRVAAFFPLLSHGLPVATAGNTEPQLRSGVSEERREGRGPGHKQCMVRWHTQPS